MTTSQKIHQTKLSIIIIAVVLVLILTAMAVFAFTRTPSAVIESVSLTEEYIEDRTDLDWSNSATYHVELSETLTITSAGIYHLSGKIPNGVVKVNTEDNVKLILDNVEIKNSSGPAIFVQNAKNVVIYLVGENYLEDGSSYKSYAEDEVGVIFSHDDLFFDGDGTLTVKSNNEDAIVSKDDLKFFGGIYNITAADDAIRGKDSVQISGGDFTISAAADGIKSTNTTDDGKGYVRIENGTFNLKVGDDGIHASSELTINDGKIIISESYEGLEGATVIINGGDISVAASDDGINAAGGNDASGFGRPGFDPFHANVDSSDTYIEFNGGKIIVSAKGDGIDSNGSIYMNGGELIVYGPTDGANGALDYDATFVMTGGTLLAGGASGMSQGVGSSSTVYSVNIFFSSNVSLNTAVKIIDESGAEIASYQSAKSYNSLVVASPKFAQGKTYTIKVGDETYQNFTISSTVTQIGSSGMNNGFRPMDGGFTDRGQIRR